MTNRLGTLAAAAAVCLTLQVLPAQASEILTVTSRADFPGDDALDWGQLGICGELLPIQFLADSDRRLATGTEGVEVIASTATGNAELRDQGCGWTGNFSPGAHLVWTQANGPLTLLFDVSLFGVGTQFQADFPGPFAAQIDAYSGNDLLDSVFNEFGDSNGNADNSAIFLGVLDPAGRITSVVLTIFGSLDDTDFAINELSIATEPVPEPASLVLFGTGALALARGARRRHRDKTAPTKA